MVWWLSLLTLQGLGAAGHGPVATCAAVVTASSGVEPTEASIAALVVAAGAQLAHDSLTTLPPAKSDATFAASSHSTWRDVVYSPDMAFDRDYHTAWVEGRKGFGVGEWIEMRWSGAGGQRAIGILLVAGFAKNDFMYRRNSRPSRLRVELGCGDGQPPLRCELRPSDRRVPQAFVFPRVVHLSGACHLRLLIHAVRAGSHYKDTSIAEVRLLVRGPSGATPR